MITNKSPSVQNAEDSVAELKMTISILREVFENSKSNNDELRKIIEGLNRSNERQSEEIKELRQSRDIHFENASEATQENEKLRATIEDLRKVSLSRLVEIENLRKQKEELEATLEKTTSFYKTFEESHNRRQDAIAKIKRIVESV